MGKEGAHLLGYVSTGKPNAGGQGPAFFTSRAPSRGILEYRLTVPSTRTGYLTQKTTRYTMAIVSF